MMIPDWWAVRDLNTRPSGCKPDALTAELTAHRLLLLCVQYITRLRIFRQISFRKPATRSRQTDSDLFRGGDHRVRALCAVPRRRAGFPLAALLWRASGASANWGPSKCCLSEYAPVPRQVNHLKPIAGPHAAQHAVDMVLYGLLGKVQVRSDLFICQTLRNQGDQLLLPAC